LPPRLVHVAGHNLGILMRLLIGAALGDEIGCCRRVWFTSPATISAS
jgi:hypothetical protein